jgi:hypothetical protein
MTLALVLAAEKSPAQEGRDVVLSMLVVGLVFLGVVLLGQLARYLGHKRQARRAERRVY